VELFGEIMKKLKVSILILFAVILGVSILKLALADTAIDKGLNFLKSKQDATGRINTGFSAPSQWSAIAFAANGVDMSSIKNPSVSLGDFLVNNIPSEPSSATDWETRILAIVATSGNPTNYGGVNYITHLESFYNNSQIGDTCSLNDDIFGLLAEVAAGSSSTVHVKQDVLNFLIAKQDTTDGGFGYSAPGCAFYSTSADMTGAAIQALVAAKENGLTNPELDDAIVRAKNYLLANQDSDGGYGYYGSSDTDTTGWVLMAFNVLDMQNSTPSAKTKEWLISQQSEIDGGFLAYDYGLSSFASNSTTTAQALIGLSGKSWILKIFDSSQAITPSPASTQTSTPTPTPASSSNTTSDTPTPTPTPAQAAIPEIMVQKDSTFLGEGQTASDSQISPTPKTAVLGAKSSTILNSSENKNTKNLLLTIIFTGFGLFFTFTYLIKMFIMRRLN